MIIRVFLWVATAVAEHRKLNQFDLTDRKPDQPAIFSRHQPTAWFCPRYHTAAASLLLWTWGAPGSLPSGSSLINSFLSWVQASRSFAQSNSQA